MSIRSLVPTTSAALLFLSLTGSATAQSFGGFSAPIYLEVFVSGSGRSLSKIAVVDVDLDGDNDILVTATNPPELARFTNNGDGTLLAPAFFPTGPAFLEPIGGFVTGDFNGDGFPDAATGNIEPTATPSNSISIMLNDGAGGYSSSAIIPVTGLPLGLAEGDFNDDGARDLAISVNEPLGGQNRFEVFLGNGDGTFVAVGPLPITSFQRSVASADLDGDGRDDLMAAIGGDAGVGQASLRFATMGSGSFGPEILVDMTNANEPAHAIIPVDIDGDDVPDLIAGTQYDDGAGLEFGITVVENDGSGTFGQLQFFPTSAIGDQFVLNARDMDANDFDDVLVLQQVSGTLLSFLTLMINDGTGDFTGESPIQLDFLTGGMENGDIDGSGSPDVVVVQQNTLVRPEGVLVETGAGIWLIFNETTFPLLGDLNGDGCVNGADLATLLAVWGTDGGETGADLNGDGVVDGADLATLLANWHDPCTGQDPPPQSVMGGPVADSAMEDAFLIDESAAPAQMVQSLPVPWIIAELGFTSVQDYIDWVELLSEEALFDHISELIQILLAN